MSRVRTGSVERAVPACDGRGARGAGRAGGASAPAQGPGGGWVGSGPVAWSGGSRRVTAAPPETGAPDTLPGVLARPPRRWRPWGHDSRLLLRDRSRRRDGRLGGQHGGARPAADRAGARDHRQGDRPQPQGAVRSLRRGGRADRVAAGGLRQLAAVRGVRGARRPLTQPPATDGSTWTTAPSGTAVPSPPVNRTSSPST